ncbi:pyrimidine reductase family protein [Williamsia maris]|uniref:Pyrimidine reductase, riboflavin biosynthesis n=1 Tax=Williamsia maris TaxID=72806 RepID=A0ABT1HKG8_9NOCA|nr:pyrimidine reductase family protein [Williamsia maris]MCP2178421.1 Pyrimidine reductase, riboflavin biosynthesis [Williamsia maris]
MYLLDKATQLTVDRATLTDLYAYPPAPDLDGRCHLVANMVTSLDGAAMVGGVSGALGGDGDHEIFELLRELCDVVLVGSGTVIGEDYGPIRGDSDADTAPRLAMVSGSLSIDPAQGSVAAPTTVIMTCASAPEENRRRLLDVGATLVDCGETEVELPRVLSALADRGRNRVLCEGGPGLLANLYAADLVDDLCVTIGPTIVGGSAGRITHGPDGAPTRQMRRAHVLADDEGYLFTRWVRA